MRWRRLPLERALAARFPRGCRRRIDRDSAILLAASFVVVVWAMAFDSPQWSPALGVTIRPAWVLAAALAATLATGPAWILMWPIVSFAPLCADGSADMALVILSLYATGTSLVRGDRLRDELRVLDFPWNGALPASDAWVTRKWRRAAFESLPALLIFAGVASVLAPRPWWISVVIATSAASMLWALTLTGVTLVPLSRSRFPPIAGYALYAITLAPALALGWMHGRAPQPMADGTWSLLLLTPSGWIARGLRELPMHGYAGLMWWLPPLALTAALPGLKRRLQVHYAILEVIDGKPRFAGDPPDTTLLATTRSDSGAASPSVVDTAGGS